MTIQHDAARITDWSDYTLRLATIEQVHQHWKAQFTPWQRDQTWETFRVWVLVRRDDYDGRMYAGVESFRRDAFMRAKGADHVAKTTVYGISSVVTPVDLLRRGCATFMLKLLHYCLADPSNLPAFPSEWGAPPCLTSAERKQVPYGIASMLWSDVGATFYEKCTIGRDLPGWVLLEEENQEVVWKLQTPKEEKDWD